MRKKDRWLAPDLTPLIDIVFLLLIFFMVSSVFKKDQSILDIDLPSSQAKSTQQKQKTCTIELNDKYLAYDGKKVSFNDFKASSKNISKAKILILKIDEKVQYKRIMKLFNILKENDLNNISLLQDSSINK